MLGQQPIITPDPDGPLATVRNRRRRGDVAQVVVASQMLGYS